VAAAIVITPLRDSNLKKKPGIFAETEPFREAPLNTYYVGRRPTGLHAEHWQLSGQSYTLAIGDVHTP
jgi:hypothetical protein